MKPQYCIICYAGMDLYDHERRVQQVATDYCDEDTMATKFDIYKQHSEKRLDNGAYAWATVCIVKMTANESTIVQHWGQEKPLKEKIQLNKPAKTTKTPLSVAEAIDIWGGIGAIQGTATTTAGFHYHPPQDVLAQMPLAMDD